MLNDTGERIIPEMMKPTNQLLLEHIARYSFSIPFIQGRVLDMACGTGYGAHMVAKIRNKSIDDIYGVDIDLKTVNYAQRTYNHPKISFRQGDILDPELPQKLGTFDVIMSFETIEHVEDDIFFIRQLKQMLKPNGTLILSTPFGQGRGIPCAYPFHVHQLTQHEFIHLFHSFQSVHFYLQQGVAIQSAHVSGEHVSGELEEKHLQPDHGQGCFSLGIAVAQ